MIGKVKKLHDTFGFIRDSDSIDYFFHMKETHNFNKLDTGDTVEFDFIDTPRGRRAVNVRHAKVFSGLGDIKENGI